MPDPRFHLKCLGEPSVAGPDGQPLRIRVRKHFALLVYLVLERDRRHRREHLAELLWPNLPEADGKHSLATAVTSLRAAFGSDVVDSDRYGLRWAFGLLDVDLDRLEAGDILGDDSGQEMLDVGAFLDGFEIPGATDFMLWRERQRARWLPRVRDALVTLMDRCRRTGDSRQIEQLADRMLQLDELSEEAIRGKMEARAFAGDRLSALRIFETWKQSLREELGAEPSPLLEGMALRLRKRGWERTSHRRIAAVRTEQWKDRPFIGRRHEYRSLYEAWERARRGEAGHVLVTGESGVGKSTLVERLSTAAGLEGASVSRAQCYELEREIPFAALGGLVHGLLDCPGSAATSPEALAELARAVPEVRRRYTNLPEPQDTEGETARYRIAESLYELVHAVADEHPLILIVDDHHFADDASLALLHILLRRLDGHPVMLVLVARSSEMAESPHAIQLRDNLPRFGTATIRLEPLPESDSTALIAALVAADGPEPSPAVRRALLHAGRGYPMVMELLCRDWREHGEQSLVLSLDAMTTDPAATGTPIEAIQQLHRRVAGQLSPVARSVLSLSALLGSRLNDVAMYEILDLSIGQVAEGMTQLADSRVLRDHGATLHFSNELFRAHVYMEIPSTLRRTLHGAVADKLIDAEADGEKIAGLEIAWHCMRSGRAAEGTTYLLRGSREAIDRGAPHEAELALSSSLSALESSDHTVSISLLLTEAQQEQGQWAHSLQTLNRIALANSQSVLKIAYRSIAEAQLGLLEDHECMERLSALSTLLAEPAPQEDVAVVARAASVLVLHIRDDGRANTLLRTMNKLQQELPSIGSHCDWRLGMLRLRYQTGERRTLVPAMAQLDKDMLALGYKSSVRADLLLGTGATLCGMGQYVRAIEFLDHSYCLARDLDNYFIASSAAVNIALCSVRLGRFDQALVWAETSLRLGGARQLPYRITLAHYCQSVAHAMRGEIAEAISRAVELEHGSDVAAPVWARQARGIYLADALWLAGKRKQAVNVATKVQELWGATAVSKAFAGSQLRWAIILTSENERSDTGLTTPTGSELDHFEAIQKGICDSILLELQQRDSQSSVHRSLTESLSGSATGEKSILLKLFSDFSGFRFTEAF